MIDVMIDQTIDLNTVNLLIRFIKIHSTPKVDEKMRRDDEGLNNRSNLKRNLRHSGMKMILI